MSLWRSAESQSNGLDFSRRLSPTPTISASRGSTSYLTLLNCLNRFPMDLDVRCKATLIGAAFLIDYMFFEKKANNENDGIGMAS